MIDNNKDVWTDGPEARQRYRLVVSPQVAQPIASEYSGDEPQEDVAHVPQAPWGLYSDWARSALRMRAKHQHERKSVETKIQEWRDSEPSTTVGGPAPGMARLCSWSGYLASIHRTASAAPHPK